MCKLLPLNLRASALAIVAATGVGACSADISRLDGSMLGVSGDRTGSVNGGSSTLGDAAGETGWRDSGPRTRSNLAAAPAATPPVDRRFTPPPYQPPYSSPATATRQAAATPAEPAVGYPGNANRYAPVTAAPLPASKGPQRVPSLERSAVPSGAAPVGGGRTITVEKGDTLYGLSRRHGVRIADLKSANGLTSNALKLGQQLVVPGPGGNSGARQAVGLSESGAPRLEPRVGSPAAAAGGDVYVVRRGDSLYRIARANGITSAELQRINGITDPRKVMPGTELRLRGTGAGGSIVRARVATVKTVTTAAPEAPPRAVPARTDIRPAPATTRPQPVAAPLAGGSQPRIINSASGSAPGAPPAGSNVTRMASAPAAAATHAGSGAATAAAAVNAGKFRWPATGRIVSAFGPRPDGSHNDGINILVPHGTPVHAAEAGTVAYAGNELQGYGNLILIRHDNGWVSAYAHNEALLVRHGDRVARGQVVAKAGKTGSVDQPQIHFELRDGAKPVDPRPHLAKL
ncbi:MAG: peptidoglycan DD-metalloendopeptidase family protein [Hyphomicrobiaceae bacterium]